MPKRFQFEMRPRLLTQHLGADLYRTPASALAQLIDNSLDAGCKRVEVTTVLDDLGTATKVTIVDDGCGISPDRLHHAFAAVGEHFAESASRDTIGTKGIGRFAVFRLAYRVAWNTVAGPPESRVRQRWEMLMEQPTPPTIDAVPAGGEPTGTQVEMFLRQGDPSLQALFRSTPTMKRELFVAFAAYLARYESSVQIIVNGEPIALADYVMERSSERIDESAEVPAAELHHFLMEGRVQLEFPNVLLFAASGATVKTQKLDTDPLQGRKYLGLVDSPYLANLTSTGKSDFAIWDDRFNALASEAAGRALRYVAARRGDRAQTFIEEARAEPFYPYRGPAESPLQRYSQSLYDSVLIAFEESTKISGLPPAQKRLVFALTHRLLRGEDDLAAVLTDVLGLEGEEITRFADVLRSTTLRSMVAMASLVVDRLSFLRDLDTIVYGAPAKHVRERSQLHKIVEGHSWLFGESYNLMTSDKRIKNVLEEARTRLGLAAAASEDLDDAIEVDPDLRLIPDLYLVQSNKVEGPDYFQHLIVEMKAPRVRLAPKHIDQLKQYARAIVQHPTFGERTNDHHFQFVLVSSEVSNRVKEENYQSDAPPGLIGKPALGHYTELWAVPWSHFLDDRRSELNFLQSQVDLTADADALAYLRHRVPDLIPPEINDAPSV